MGSMHEHEAREGQGRTSRPGRHGQREWVVGGMWAEQGQGAQRHKSTAHGRSVGCRVDWVSYHHHHRAPRAHQFRIQTLVNLLIITGWDWYNFTMD